MTAPDQPFDALVAEWRKDQVVDDSFGPDVEETESEKKAALEDANETVDHTDGFCRMPSCGRESFTRGFCEPCYQRWIYRGRPADWPILPKAKTGPKPGQAKAVEPVENERERPRNSSVRSVRNLLVAGGDDARLVLGAIRRARSMAAQMGLDDVAESLGAGLASLAAVQESLRTATQLADRALSGSEDFNRIGNETIAVSSPHGGGRVAPKGRAL